MIAPHALLICKMNVSKNSFLKLRKTLFGKSQIVADFVQCAEHVPIVVGGKALPIEGRPSLVSSRRNAAMHLLRTGHDGAA
jgi:hypothetical protein